MDNVTLKQTENKLFELICSEIDVFSVAHNINIDCLISSSGISVDDILTMIDNLVKNKLIYNVAITHDNRLSCHMTIEGLKRFHEALNV